MNDIAATELINVLNQINDTIENKLSEISESIDNLMGAIREQNELNRACTRTCTEEIRQTIGLIDLEVPNVHY